MRGFTSSTYRQEGFCVSPKSREEICSYAEGVRQLFFPGEQKALDIVRLVEQELPCAYEDFHYDIVPDGELPDREAEFVPVEYCIRIRESIYTRACDHDGHCRFTLAHELGHFFMHRKQYLAFARSAADGFVPLYRNSEWQADTFARSLLAPARLAQGMSEKGIAKAFEVSRSVARIVHEEVAAMYGVQSGPAIASPSGQADDGFLPGLDWSVA